MTSEYQNTCNVMTFGLVPGLLAVTVAVTVTGIFSMSVMPGEELRMF